MVRKLLISDTDFVIDCLLTMAKESPVYGDVVQSVDYVALKLRDMLEDRNFIGLIDPGRGFMIGYCAPQWYTPERHAIEMLLYVLPEYRGTRSAWTLLTYFEAEAKQREAKEIRCGVTASINDRRAFKLYEKLGYERLGTGVRKRI